MKKSDSELRYLSGFGNHFETEAIADTLPLGQNNPQQVKHGLYAEQLSGTSFTSLRHENQRSWLYRIRPSVTHSEFHSCKHSRILSSPLSNYESEAKTCTPPNQMRWDPLAYPESSTHFVDSIVTMVVNGSCASHTGCAVHLYAATSGMENRFFYNADGDFLIVPQEGRLLLKTEFGNLQVVPGEIAVIQRGIKFQVDLPDQKARGYICENYGAHFQLPQLGPIGSNGLANPRDFLTPVAAFEDKSEACVLLTKFNGSIWESELDHSPLDVVAWHGNYAPYKYDLKNFNTINTVSFDHPDPSIFTVLTSPSSHPGVANIDFVIFPPRWMVAQNTFRPPYYHRNIMSEFMGLIHGVYDAKIDQGFVPGGSSLHNCMSAHGPDAASFEQATKADLKPHYLDQTLAFMFESNLVFNVTDFALNGGLLQKNYLNCWKGLKKNFRGK